MKKIIAIMPAVALFLGAVAPSVKAAPPEQPATAATAMCQDLPKSEPWQNHPTHVWNVVWRNKVAACNSKTPLGELQSAKVTPLPAQASQPTVTAPAIVIVQENGQSPNP